MAFNRNRSSRGGGFRPRFNDRGSNRGPVTMHKAICDNCSNECEVPFRPTSGKPIFCSNCFENKRGSDSGRFEGKGESRQMFEAVCDECGNKCQVPFRPSGDKPIYCSNCFGDKKNSGGKDNGTNQPQNNKQLEQLNQKLDKILNILMPIASEVEEEIAPQDEEVEVEKKTKAPKKPSAKKK